MKIKEGFSLRQVGDENIIIATGASHVDFSRIISLNEPAARLWKEIEQKEFTAGELAGLLQEWYEVDKATAEKDARALAGAWLKAGIVEE